MNTLWIARDGNKDLYLFPDKPELDEHDTIYCGQSEWIKIPSTMFPEITFDNSPVEVELTIRKQ